jgi:hypothetical protein
MALHEQSVGATNEWYTPEPVFTALGCAFDVDVASPGQAITPWIPAAQFITTHDEPIWRGFIWMNAPFGARMGLVPWLERFFQHGSGIALVPDRTSCPWWQEFAPQADLMLCVAHKIKFIGGNGQPNNSSAQGTSLLAIGPQGIAALERAHRCGFGSLFKPMSAREVGQCR